MQASECAYARSAMWEHKAAEELIEYVSPDLCFRHSLASRRRMLMLFPGWLVWKLLFVGFSSMMIPFG